jgi:ORF6N domain
MLIARYYCKGGIDMDETAIVPIELIENKIYIIRGQKVMLDRDLAELYGVETSSLNRQVRRNIVRFPEDFMFQITVEEYNNLICQNGISSSGTKRSNLISQTAMSSWGGRRHLPYAFTQEGIAMLSSVLNSQRAIQVNIAIMRVFVRIKQMISAHKELAHKLEQLEQKVGKNSEDIQLIFQAIHQLMEPKPGKTSKIGFIK